MVKDEGPHTSLPTYLIKESGATHAMSGALTEREVSLMIKDFHDRKIEPTATEVAEVVGINPNP